jgi:hypothetical protein
MANLVEIIIVANAEQAEAVMERLAHAAERTGGKVGETTPHIKSPNRRA